MKKMIMEEKGKRLGTGKNLIEIYKVREAIFEYRQFGLGVTEIYRQLAGKKKLTMCFRTFYNLYRKKGILDSEYNMWLKNKDENKKSISGVNHTNVEQSIMAIKKDIDDLKKGCLHRGGHVQETNKPLTTIRTEPGVIKDKPKEVNPVVPSMSPADAQRLLDTQKQIQAFFAERDQNDALKPKSGSWRNSATN